MYGTFLLMHVLGATIWTGGHIVLVAVVLPRVLREKSPQLLLDFESRYEKIGMPALVIQVLTGLHLAHRLLGENGAWFDFANPVSALITTKIILLFIMVLFALDARLRIIPNLNENNLVALAWHIIPVTIISILYVVIGVAFRTGWFY